MNRSVKLYCKFSILLVYSYSLLLCLTILSEPLIKNFKAFQFSYIIDDYSKESDNLINEQEIENDDETQDVYLYSHLNTFQLPILNTYKYFTNRFFDYVSVQKDILIPPPKVK